MVDWFPYDEARLKEIIKSFLSDLNKKKTPVLIVPHAGYAYSGKIAGKAFSLVDRNLFDKVVIIGPSHYINFNGVRTLEEIKTPFGKVELIKNDFPKIPKAVKEHSVINQVPFVQYIFGKGVRILPLVVGDIENRKAKEIADYLEKEFPDSLFIFSTDLSHFLPYKDAVMRDKKTIKRIEQLNFDNFDEINACGRNALLILFYLCDKKGLKPRLIEYKNSGNITGEKGSVVGYASFFN